MRLAACGALALLLTLANLAPGQFPPPGPGRGVGHGGKRAVVTGFVIRGPVFGFGYMPAFGFGMPVVRTTVVIAPTVMVSPGFARLEESVPIEREKPLPFDPDGVLVIRPRPGGVANLPAPREAQLGPPPKLAEPAPKAPGREPAPRQAPAPDPDADTENERQNNLGRDAFAAGEYGRAADRFAQAIRVAPKKPLSHFLRAQAQFALGKYRDATASILAGLKLQPDWPATKFNPRELYGENAADHALHLERLRLALERSPDEPALLFLYGYQLWFNGRRNEAKPFFRQAAPLTTDPKPIEGFLNEPDGKVVVR